MSVQYRFDDEVKDDTHGVSTPKFSSFLKQPEHSLKVLPTNTPDYPYSVSLSGSRTRSRVSCDQGLRVRTAGLSRDGFTLKGGIGSSDQKFVEKLVRAHTNLVLRESLDNTLRHLLPWDIEFVIDEPLMRKKRNRKFKCGLLSLKPT